MTCLMLVLFSSQLVAASTLLSLTLHLKRRELQPVAVTAKATRQPRA